MPSFKVTLAAPVTVTAYCNIIVVAETDEAAAEKAMDVYTSLEQNYQIQLKAYRKNLSLPYPESPCSWYVNTEDIEANIDEHEIEVDDTGMIEP